MILIVDDYLDTCHPLAALLRMEGIETRCHNDPRAAIEDIERRPPEPALDLDRDPGLRDAELGQPVRRDFGVAPSRLRGTISAGQIRILRALASSWDSIDN